MYTRSKIMTYFRIFVDFILSGFCNSASLQIYCRLYAARMTPLPAQIIEDNTGLYIDNNNNAKMDSSIILQVHPGSYALANTVGRNSTQVHNGYWYLKW